MSREDLAVVRRIIGLGTQADFAAMAADFAADAEVILEADVSPNPDSYRGSERIRWFFESVLRAWSKVDVELRSIEVIGDYVIADIVYTMTGRSTGAEVQSHQSHLFKLCDGQIALWRLFGERGHALEAAGRGRG
jgi:ketosteroid isomerase-like protein